MWLLSVHGYMQPCLQQVPYLLLNAWKQADIVRQAVSVCCCCVQEEALAEQAIEAEVDLRSMEAAHPQDASKRDAGSWQGSWGELFYSQDDLGSNGSSRPSSSEPGLASSAGSDASSSNGGPTASPLTGFGLAGGAGPAPNSSAAAPAAPGRLSARYIRDEQENKKWPVLREGDGGRHVHALHAALERKGYWPGEDDMRWWQYGDATVSAMQSAQVSCAHGCANWGFYRLNHASLKQACWVPVLPWAPASASCRLVACQPAVFAR